MALSYLLRPQTMVEGAAIADFEAVFAQAIQSHHAVSFASGRVALFAVLKALGIAAGDEVLLQVPTHVVVANAIRYLGARPSYVDCRLDTYNMDFERAEALVRPRTKALILQHTFGIPADVRAAVELCRARDLTLIEDCVHSLGASFDGQPVGSFGRAAFFSTEETKTISTTMGGVVTTDDAALATRMREIQARCALPSPWLTARYLGKLVAYHVLTEPRVHGITRAVYESLGRRQPLPGPTAEAEKYGQRPAGYERRLSNAQAAIGVRQLRRLPANLAHRERVVRAYAELLSARGIPAPRPAEGGRAAYVRYPVWTSDKLRATRAIRPFAVPGTWFSSVLEEAASPAYGAYREGSCPNAELVATHVVNLPTHPRVHVADAEPLVSALADVLVPPPEPCEGPTSAPGPGSAGRPAVGPPDVSRED